MTDMPTERPGPMPWPGPIQAVTLFQEDLPAAVRFYSSSFGLEPVFGDEDSSVFRYGGTLINLLRVSAAHELVAPAAVGERGSGKRCALTLAVDDVDARCRELAARGVSLLNGPLDRPWGIRTASFEDPGGHLWEISGPVAGE